MWRGGGLSFDFREMTLIYQVKKEFPEFMDVMLPGNPNSPDLRYFY